ncbi:MAG: dual specificity protein phosphatase family protein [Acidobacteriia bacterium]|nr:dual specificity protein phosphatase family protein [Terriglobia bacterium]
MDMTWVTDRIAVGGGIWTGEKMAQVAGAGITHIIDMQIEFDDTALAEPHGVQVLWNPTDDDFQVKGPEVFQRAVDFALQALNGEAGSPERAAAARAGVHGNGNRLFIHCAAGVHRAPMMTLAILRVLGFPLPEAMELIESRRPVVDFAAVYVRSVENFIRTYESAAAK